MAAARLPGVPWRWPQMWNSFRVFPAQKVILRPWRWKKNIPKGPSVVSTTRMSPIQPPDKCKICQCRKFCGQAMPMLVEGLSSLGMNFMNKCKNRYSLSKWEADGKWSNTSRENRYQHYNSWLKTGGWSSSGVLLVICRPQQNNDWWAEVNVAELCTSTKGAQISSRVGNH